MKRRHDLFFIVIISLVTILFVHVKCLSPYRSREVVTYSSLEQRICYNNSYIFKTRENVFSENGHCYTKILNNKGYYNKGKFYVWKTGEIGCLAVQVISHINKNLTNELRVSLFSKTSIIPTKRVKCFYSSGVCYFTFKALESDIYNISISGATSRAFPKGYCNNSLTLTDSWPLERMGFSFGRIRQIKPKSLIQLIIISNPSLINTSLPISQQESSIITPIKRKTITELCKFNNELSFFDNYWDGTPRWRSYSWDYYFEPKIRKIWYNDSYIWGNDKCRYLPVDPEQFSLKMMMENIRLLLLFIIYYYCYYFYYYLLFLLLLFIYYYLLLLLLLFNCFII